MLLPNKLSRVTPTTMYFGNTKQQKQGRILAAIIAHLQEAAVHMVRIPSSKFSSPSSFRWDVRAKHDSSPTYRRK